MTVAQAASFFRSHLAQVIVPFRVFSSANDLVVSAKTSPRLRTKQARRNMGFSLGKEAEVSRQLGFRCLPPTFHTFRHYSNAIRQQQPARRRFLPIRDQNAKKRGWSE